MQHTQGSAPNAAIDAESWLQMVYNHSFSYGRESERTLAQLEQRYSLLTFNCRDQVREKIQQVFQALQELVTSENYVPRLPGLAEEALLSLVGVEWVNRAGNVKLLFSFDNKKLIAHLFQKNVADAFVESCRIPEENMAIERCNVADIARGLSQEITLINHLTLEQKLAILGSINPRNIEIIMEPGRVASLTISALS